MTWIARNLSQTPVWTPIDRREEHQPCAGCFDPFTHRGALVARQIVHDHHVTGAKLGYENLRHIRLEPIAVDRAIEHHRRDHSGHAQPRHQRGGFAVPVRKTHAQALAFGTASMAAGHVGCRPCFVDKHQALRLQIELAGEPVLTLPQDIWSILLDGMSSLFLRVMSWRTKKR